MAAGDELAEIETALKDRIETGFTGIAAISWPGVDAKLDGANFGLDVAIEFTLRARAGMGSNGVKRQNGQLVLTVIGRADGTAQVGSDEIAAHLDDLAALFPSTLSLAAGANQIRFREPSAGPLLEGDGVIGRALTCPFWMDF